MIITSKFPSRCNTCGKEVRVGDRVSWDRAVRGVSHATCSDEGKALATKVAESRAVDVEAETTMALPVPEGLSYLGYQRAGIAYAASRSTGGTLIADEMGLGKTIQAIGIVNALPDVQTVVIVCPASLKVNWARECSKWLVRGATILTHFGSRQPTWDHTPRAASVDSVGDAPLTIHIVNYDVLAKFRAPGGVDLLIADEAHYAKNPKAQRTKNLQALARASKRTVLLTGTPILNKPIELWPLLQIVAPETWDPAGMVKGKAVGVGQGAGFFRYAKRYCAAHQEQVSRTKSVWVFDGHSNLDELQEKLRATCMVRRLKADVLKELPPKRRQVIELPCEESWDEPDVGDDYEGARNRLGEVAFTEFSATRHAQAVSKVSAAVDHIRSVLESTGKVVVFAHHKDVIAALSEGLSDMRPVCLTGDMDQGARQTSVDTFVNDASCRVFIGSLKAAGVGLTLTVSSTVIFVELDWTPATLTQAEDRCHRIGQRESVLVQHLVLSGTLDAKMARMITEKQNVADAALDDEASYSGEGRADVESPEETRRRKLASEGLTEEEAAYIHAQVRFLASCCDGAKNEDGAGFNKLDTNIGKSLAALPRMSPKQASMAKKMLVKYRRQLNRFAPRAQSQSVQGQAAQ
jgi:SNF2 family DNA or RNA helicase